MCRLNLQNLERKKAIANPYLLQCPAETQCRWDSGIDWPCWDQIVSVAPEMERARLVGDLTTGDPFRYLRSDLVRPKEDDDVSEQD
jgi:hypothetical protein